MAHRVRLAGTLGLALLLALFALLPAAAAPRAAEVAVAAEDFEYNPATVTVNVGDTVVWTNTGEAPHTVTASDGSFDSGNMDAGQEFSYTFDTAGTYQYYCTYHGTADGTGMAGTVIVEEAAQQATATPAAEATATPAAEATATPAAEATATPAAEEGQQDGQTPSVTASDQSVTNNTVTVESVTAAQDGWIVIHRDQDGRPGPVIGQTAVTQGENNDVRVSLTEDVAAGDQLWAMLHIDAGTAGTYEFPGPDGPVQQDGQVVMQQFEITEGAADGQTPSQLPTTGGGGQAALLLLAALVLFAAGLGLAVRTRRPNAG